MLFVIFLFVYDDVPVDEEIIEEIKLSWLRFFSTHFCQDTLTNQDTAGDAEWLSGAAEAGLHQGDSASISFAIH